MAADYKEIADEVRYFEGDVIMTDPQAASGTDRVAEVAQQLVNVDIVVNVQGDEPELQGACIDQVIDLLERDSLADIATLATPIRSREQLLDPACTKVVFDGAGRHSISAVVLFRISGMRKMTCLPASQLCFTNTWDFMPIGAIFC